MRRAIPLALLLLAALPATAAEVRFVDRSREVARPEAPWPPRAHRRPHGYPALACRGVLSAGRGDTRLTLCLEQDDPLRRAPVAIRRTPDLGYAGPPPTRTRPPLSESELDAIIGYPSPW